METVTLEIGIKILLIVVGLLCWFFASPPKVQEVGKWTFVVALASWLGLGVMDYDPVPTWRHSQRLEYDEERQVERDARRFSIAAAILFGLGLLVWAL